MLLTRGHRDMRLGAADDRRGETTALPSGRLPFSSAYPTLVHRFIHNLCACIACGAKFACRVTVQSPGESLLLNPVGELGHLVIDGPALGHQGPDLALGMHHRGVVAAAELLTDLGQGHVGELTA